MSDGSDRSSERREPPVENDPSGEPAPEEASGAPGEATASRGDEDGEAVTGERAGERTATGDDRASALPDEESERLSAEIGEALQELEELRDRHLRLAAEFENYRRRTRRELEDAERRGQARLVERILDAVDDLDRVLEVDGEEADGEAIREGVALVARKLRKELGEAGLSRMEPLGERFDPRLHEALLTAPTGDPGEDARVSRVFTQGYLFGDRVLRPARVEVLQHVEDTPASGAEAEDGEG